MSAEVLGSASPVQTAPAPVAVRPPLSPALLEPALVNRLIAVAVAIFCVPAAVAMAALLGAETLQPGLNVVGGTLAAGALTALGFGLLLAGAPAARELRVGRALCGALAVEVAVLALSFAARLVA